MTLDVALRRRPRDGEDVSGDLGIWFENGPTITFLLADGLGHGAAAAEAASVFADYAREHLDESLEQILLGSSPRLRDTRGVVAALLRIEMGEAKMVFAGVGNVGFRAWSRTPAQPLSAAGVLGRRCRRVRSFHYEIAPGDVIALHSDGIARRAEWIVDASEQAGRIADAIVRDYASGHDDASILVIKYESHAPGVVVDES